MSVVTQFAKTVLRAPIRGVVTRQDAKVGQIVSPNVPVISIISENNLHIEANIPEVDIGKIAVGNPVQIIFDAFPQEKFTGKVFYMDPAETIIDGVVNFKVKINFDKKDVRLRSGLTANLTIQARKKDSALILPQYAIVENDRGTFVKKQKGAAFEEIPVTIGIRSKDGFVEILSGVEENEEVLNVGVKANGK